MSETKQTRCPFCNSVFNITDAQLAARGGHVRCGACLQVFRADQNLTSGVEAAPAAKPSAATAASKEDVPVAPPIVHRTQVSQAMASEPAKKKKKPDDESWAFHLIGEEDADANPATAPAEPEKPAKSVIPPESAPAAAPANNGGTGRRKPMFDDELSDLLQEAWHAPVEDTGPLKGIGEVDKIKDSADESWAQALLEESKEEEKRAQAKNYSMELSSKEAPKTAADNRNSKDKDKEKDTPRKAASEAQRREPASGNKAAPANTAPNDDLLDFLNNNSAPTIHQRSAELPVEIRQKAGSSIDWGYFFTWTFLCVLAALLLISQYLYFNFEALALSAKTRPQVIELCAVLKCRVPDQPDLSKLSVRKLVVRKHPDISGALRADVILYNSAAFTQPLPALKLVFMNRKGEVVAGRIFQPKEYLSGDFANLRRIPPDTPIHLEIDMANPKVDMVSYAAKPLL